MPTSNGQVTARDIRQGSVKTFHVVDENITTGKLADLAASIAKTEAPFEFAAGVDRNSNPTITTTETSFVSVDIDVPSWASLMAAVVLYRVQVSASANKNLSVVADFNNPPIGGWTVTLTSGEIATNLDLDVVVETVTPGSTVTFQGFAWVSTGTETSNLHRLEVLAVFQR